MMKICVATGTRAEYGLLKPLIDKISAEDTFELQILVTGAHLSPEFGLTYLQILSDGYDNIEKVEMLLSSDSATGIVKSMGLGMIGYADAFERLKPDLLIILGDRYEMLAVASAALIFKIPIAHLHGGELTEGAYDDSIRHAITKMSSLHFTSTEVYKDRVIQMGEQPENVHNVGAIGLDNIKTMPLSSLEELEEQLQIKFLEYNYLITLHPETLSCLSVEIQFQELLNALDTQENSFFIFTKANADTSGRVINKMIDDYVNNHTQNAIAFNYMGQLRYLSAMKHCTAVIGNSSSGIIEAPSFNKPVINIGNRQKGRIQGKLTFNVAPKSEDLKQTFDKLKVLITNKEIDNPYGVGNTSTKIMDIIKKTNLKNLVNKQFNNLPTHV
jgi:GDP/UDP-N,N'-diacetylbacillosamine 2-epimerase (hydrolysing)